MVRVVVCPLTVVHGTLTRVESWVGMNIKIENFFEFFVKFNNNNFLMIKYKVSVFELFTKI